MPALNQALDANLKMQNSSNNLKQIQRLQERYKTPEAGQGQGRTGGRVPLRRSLDVLMR